MSTVTIRNEAQRLVLSAAEPVDAGESVKSQIRRSCARLRMDRDKTLCRRHRAAWYGEAGTWGAAIFQDLKSRFEAWDQRQRQKDARARQTVAADLERIAERLAATDPAFFRADIGLLRGRARALRGLVGGGDQ